MSVVPASALAGPPESAVAFQAPEPGKHAVPVGALPGGDSLRGYASLMVVYTHVHLSWAQYAAARDPGHSTGGVLANLAFSGYPAIYLFFALSGYLVGGPWIRAFLGEGRTPRLKRYVDHRVRRVVPIFWFVFLALLVLEGTDGATTRQVVSIPLFAQVFTEFPGMLVLNQGWTLDVEAMFYVSVPLAFWAFTRVAPRPDGPASRRRRLGLLAALGIIGAATMAARVGPFEQTVEVGQRTLLTLSWAFLPGLALAAIEVPARRRLAGTELGRRIALALVALGAASFTYLLWSEAHDGSLEALLAYAVCAIGFLAGALVWSWSTQRTLPTLEVRAAAAIGRWSYSIYLTHIAVVIWIGRHQPSWLGLDGLLPWTLALTLLICLPLSAALWKCIEEPLLRTRMR